MRVDRHDRALDNIIDPETKIERVATGFKFTEGPMWRKNRLWFSDLVGNKLFAVDSSGALELLMDCSGGLQNPPPGYCGSNAMATDKDGNVVLLQHGLRRAVKVDDSLTVHPFLDRFEGKRLNSPNDLVFAPDGAMWFTDPSFGLPGMDKDPEKELPFNGVYRYADGKLSAPIRDLSLPNGLAFTPDGKTLYVANSGPKMFVNKYAVNSRGEIESTTRFIEYPDDPNADLPDGLKVDLDGNVWTAGPGGIRILSPEAKMLGQIILPETAANLGWAEEGKTLYITGSTSIYRLRVKNRGYMPIYTR